jgi:hypothetical protein
MHAYKPGVVVMTVILATLEVEIGRIAVQGHPRHKSENLFEK